MPSVRSPVRPPARPHSSCLAPGLLPPSSFLAAAGSQLTTEVVRVCTYCLVLQVARLEALLHTLTAAAAAGPDTRDASAEVAASAHSCGAAETGAAGRRGREGGGRDGSRDPGTNVCGEPAVVKGSATSYLGGPAQQDMHPGPKGKRSLLRGQGGVKIRKGQQQKGGVFAADCYEESMWDPKIIMPALGIQPIGHVRTCFPRRNGCPRQGSVVPASRAKLELVFGSNPAHGLKGLEDFSHVWLLFLFDGNGTSYTPRPNVYPPRLLGKSKGVFATRSPHRPCPIGLSLCKVEAIQGRTLVMSGVDLVDGTPIIDLKPYIPCYDAPYANGDDGSEDWGVEWAAKLKLEGKDLRYPEWCVPAAQPLLKVHLTEDAEAQLAAIARQHKKPRVLASWDHVRDAIVQVLQADPRSIYRKESCVGQVYPFFVDALEVQVEFCDDGEGVGVLARVLCLEYVPLSLQRTVPKAGNSYPEKHASGGERREEGGGEDGVQPEGVSGDGEHQEQSEEK